MDKRTGRNEDQFSSNRFTKIVNEHIERNCEKVIENDKTISTQCWSKSSRNNESEKSKSDDNLFTTFTSN